MLFVCFTVYGVLAGLWNMFPATLVRQAIISSDAVFKEFRRPWVTDILADASMRTRTIDPEKISPGLLLVSGVNEDQMNFAKVIDRDGNEIHSWRIDWFTTWDDDEGRFAEFRRPKGQPGSLAHGMQLMPNGDLVFNFEWLSTVRLNPCGAVVWKRDNWGHHSVDVDDQGFIWVGGLKALEPDDRKFMLNVGLGTPIPSVQKLDSNGQVIREINVFEVLNANGLEGLAYMSSIENNSTRVWGDTLHLNDVEIFPSDRKSAVFSTGDIMISLRNIQTILVFDPDTLKVKFLSIGKLLRQHDPDFVGDDRISVFDNRNLEPLDGSASRIASIDTKTGEVSTLVGQENGISFYTSILGKHQVIHNGNVLITSSQQGRAFEVTSQGQIVWDYFNRIDDGYLGVLFEVSVLDSKFDPVFFQQARQRCAGESN